MITRTELNGVPTLVAPSQGPLRAGLMFRVGRADETLATSGITHLVEHLALNKLALADYHIDGSTWNAVTHFQVQGSEDDVTGYLTGVCAALANLPLDRLEREKDILRTEAQNRPRTPLSLWRYGAMGYGLPSYPEWGLNRLTAQDVRDWTDTWFTVDNAVLWIAGPGVPAGLTLNLPRGRRMAPPEPTNALPVTPAYFSDGTGNIVWQGVTRRDVAASVFAAVLERELFRSLRQDGGYSYTAATSYDPRDDGMATVIAVADALADQQGAALGAFVDVLAKLRMGRIEESDIDAVKAKAREGFDHPQLEAARLPTLAKDLLLNRPSVETGQLWTDLAAVTVADVHEVALEAIGTALLQVPQGMRADWAGFTAAPHHSDRVVTGHSHPSTETDGLHLIIGSDGVSKVHGSDAATVLWGQCQAMLRWPDGARQLIGADGIQVSIEPTLWTAPGQAWEFIDSAVPPSVIVPMPARNPVDIPQPTPPEERARARAAQTEESDPSTPTRAPFSTGSKVLLGLFIVIALLAVCCSGITTLATRDDPEADSMSWGVIGAFWCITLFTFTPIWLLLRQRARE